MGVSSYFEFVVTLFGWVLYDNLWAVLAGSGLVYLPFAMLILTHIVNSRKGGDDEGLAAVQSLKKIETDLVVMVLVLLIACIPFTNVQLGNMQYSKPALDCKMQAQTINGTNTGTTYDQTLQTLGGQTGRAPLWWALVHIVSKSVVSASIASIPCSYDLSSVNVNIANDEIDDPRVRREVQEFITDCYMPARSQMIRNQNGLLTQNQIADTGWIGSNYFLTTPGYYDTFYSYNARQGWAYLASRDAGMEADQPLGHPYCDEWWQNSAVGLRQAILDEIDPNLLNDMVYSVDNLVSQSTTQNLNTGQREDVFLRKYIAVNVTQSDFPSDLSTSYSVGAIEEFQRTTNSGYGFSSAVHQAANTLMIDMFSVGSAAIGGALKLPGALGEGKMLREGVSIMQGLVILMFLVLLPFLLVFGLYKPSVIFTLTLVYFAMHFFSFIWGIAFWVDNNLMSTILTGSTGFGPFEAATNPTQLVIILWMQRFLYVFFPLIFLTALGWIGINFGSFGKDFSGQIGRNSEPGSAGGKAIATAATKGKG